MFLPSFAKFRMRRPAFHNYRRTQTRNSKKLESWLRTHLSRISIDFWTDRNSTKVHGNLQNPVLKFPPNLLTSKLRGNLTNVRLNNFACINGIPSPLDHLHTSCIYMYFYGLCTVQSCRCVVCIPFLLCLSLSSISSCSPLLSGCCSL